MKQLKIIFNLIKMYFYFKGKVIEAYLRYLNNGREYHVMPFPGTTVLFVVRAKDYKKAYNKLAKKYGRAQITHINKLENSLYKTPSEGLGRPSLKVK